MDEDVKKAVKELAELRIFLMDVSELPADEMVKRVEERDPSFIEHVEAMEEPPKSARDFWAGFGIWSTTGLRSKYQSIWDKVMDAYFHSEAHKKLREKYKLKDIVESQLDKILKDSDFQ